jgi:hypothetical protein
MSKHFQLIGIWIHASCQHCYNDFVRAGCRVIYVGCATGHVGRKNA